MAGVSGIGAKKWVDGRVDGDPLGKPASPCAPGVSAGRHRVDMDGFEQNGSSKCTKKAPFGVFFQKDSFSGFHDPLFSALRTGQFDHSDAARHTAIGAAGALHILVFLVGAAGLRSAQGALLRPPPLHEFCVFRTALFEVAREHTEQQIYAQKERGIVDKGGKCLPRHQGGQQAEHQLSDKQGPAELVGAVSTVHEARHRAAKLINEILQDPSHFLSKLLLFYMISPK